MWDETPEIECPECCGNGQTIVLNSGEDIICPDCKGMGWRKMTAEEEADAAEAAYERQMEDYYGGSSPMTLDEQHSAAWKQKQELKR